jgi:hypothetical protein
VVTVERGQGYNLIANASSPITLDRPCAMIRAEESGNQQWGDLTWSSDMTEVPCAQISVLHQRGRETPGGKNIAICRNKDFVMITMCLSVDVCVEGKWAGPSLPLFWLGPHRRAEMTGGLHRFRRVCQGQICSAVQKRVWSWLGGTSAILQRYHPAVLFIHRWRKSVGTKSRLHRSF